IGLEESRIARGKAVVDPDVLTLDPSVASQRLGKGRHNPLAQWIVLGESYQYADTAHPIRLLGVPGDWPCCGSAENREELAPPHTMTSSARASGDCCVPLSWPGNWKSSTLERAAWSWRSICRQLGTAGQGRLEPFTRVECDRWSRRTANGSIG